VVVTAGPAPASLEQQHPIFSTAKDNTAVTETVQIPPRMARLPRDRHDRVVPWFVAWIDGSPDHRIADADKRIQAIRRRLCWVCGKPLGAYLSFLIGPMCAVNRVTAEPPSHRDCATFSARVCPFLTTPRMRRRETGIPDEVTNPGGTMIRRNPGVSLVWTTRSYRLERDAGGVLFRVGDPTGVDWWAEGRPATHPEALESLESGLPILHETAAAEGPRALIQLRGMLEAALRLVPREEDTGS
jgi:hypothetical protein